MPLVPSFTVQATGDPSAILITDTSTGSDVAITNRVIVLYKTDSSIFGTFQFPLSAGNSITINPLTQDLALNIVLNWTNVGGIAIYTFNLIFAFVQYAYIFLQGLTQFQIANQQATSDTGWIFNKFKLFCYVKSALLSIDTGQSLSAAQYCITQYQSLIANNNFYF